MNRKFNKSKVYLTSKSNSIANAEAQLKGGITIKAKPCDELCIKSIRKKFVRRFGIYEYVFAVEIKWIAEPHYDCFDLVINNENIYILTDDKLSLR